MSRESPLPTARECCLFLDVDGTLLDIAPAPQAVVVDEPLRVLLRCLLRASDGALALVSGRTIAELDRLFDPMFLCAAGVHGCERRDAQGHWLRPAFQNGELKAFHQQLLDAVKPLDGLIIEDKICALALHYRQVPQIEGALRAVLQRLAPALPSTHEVIDGDEVLEIKPAAFNKASAIEAFMQEPPFAGRFPIFIGDDLTDQEGFAAVRRLNGMAIAVGSNVNSEWHLHDPRGVRRWLAEFSAREPPQ